MAKNYEAICESLRLAGEHKLVKLSNAFQEHQQWLKQAFEDTRAQLGARKAVPRDAKPGRGRGASDKENAPAPKRSSRKRGTPAMALESIGEEAEPEENARPKPEAPAQAEADVQTDLEANTQDSALEGAGAQGKPPLPGRARWGRAAKEEEAEEDIAQIQAADGEASTGQTGTEADILAVAAQPQTANPVRRTTRRTAKSGTEAVQPAEPARQTRRAAAIKAAAAIAAEADGEGPAGEAKAFAPTKDAAPVALDTAPGNKAQEHMAAEQGGQKALTEEDAQEEEQEPHQASRARKAKSSSGQQVSGKQAAAGDADADAVAEQEHQPSPGPARAGRRAAKIVAATPAQRKRPTASAPRTTRRMAAAERAAETKPDVQAHRLELSDEESDIDMDEDDADMEEDDAAEDTASPAAAPGSGKEGQMAEQTEATPQAVEDTPVIERAAATAARPKRAAAAAAQRAIAATAVKRQRARRMSGASLASVPGTTRRTRQAAAAEEEARATPATAAGEPAGSSDEGVPANPEVAEPQSAPQGNTPAEERDVRDAGEARSTGPLPQISQDSVRAAERPHSAEEQPSVPMTAAAEPGAAAPSVEETQPAAAETEGGDREHEAAAGEVAAANLDQAHATAGIQEAGIDQEVEEDIEIDFEEAQDVFETPSQHPRMMTPGTSFGTARQQPTAYKTGQEHLTGVQPSTGKPVFIRPELKDGPLARAAAAAAQRPAVPGGVLSAQPQDIDQAAQASESNTSAQQTGAVQRLRQQYEGTTPEEPATLAEEASQGEQRRSSPAEQVPKADAPSQEPAEDDKEGPSDGGEAAPAAQQGVAGMGANLVSTVRSFLPFVSKASDAPPQPAAGKKPVKVKALEAAEAARRKEALKATERAAQRQQVEAQKAERAKRAQDAKAAQADREEEARRLAQEALTKKEEEAAARRHAKEEAEKKEREERQKRQEELRQKRKQAEQERAAAEERSRKAAHEEDERKRKAAKQQDLEAKRPRLQGPTGQAKPAPAAASASGRAAAPAEKLAGVDLPAPPQHASAARPLAAESAADLASRPATAMPIQGVVKPSTPMAEIAKAGAADSARTGPQASSAAGGSGAAQQGRPDSEQFQSYELSPYKSGSDSEDSEEDAEREKKPVPKWARGLALTQALVAQMAVDPDEIFKLHQKTCPLNEVFSDKSASDKHPRKDLNRRTSSGNWIEDRVTWKEELNYKKAMGYL